MKSILGKIIWTLKAGANALYMCACLITALFSALTVITTVVMLIAFNETLSIAQWGIFFISATILIAILINLRDGTGFGLPFENKQDYTWLPPKTWMLALLLNDTIRNGNEFIVKKATPKPKSNWVKTKYVWTIIQDTIHTSYPVLINTNTGRCAYQRMSKKGNLYMVYLDKDVSRRLAKELKIPFVE